MTGLGASAGALTAGGGAFLYNLGASASQEELLKLQVTFREVILRSQLRSAKQAAVVGALEGQLAELMEQLAQERELNEGNACRLKRLEEIIAAYDDSIGWMKQYASEVSRREQPRARRTPRPGAGVARLLAQTRRDLAQQSCDSADVAGRLDEVERSLGGQPANSSYYSSEPGNIPDDLVSLDALLLRRRLVVSNAGIWEASPAATG